MYPHLMSSENPDEAASTTKSSEAYQPAEGAQSTGTEASSTIVRSPRLPSAKYPAFASVADPSSDPQPESGHQGVSQPPTDELTAIEVENIGADKEAVVEISAALSEKKPDFSRQEPNDRLAFLYLQHEEWSHQGKSTGHAAVRDFSVLRSLELAEKLHV